MEYTSDLLDPARANALKATLGLPTQITPGSPLPPFFHQIYFWNPRPATALGRDGHPATGSALIPDFGLPRRMWAGGQLSFHAPLLAGHKAVKHTTLAKAQKKQGRSGPLAFVTLRHDILQDGALKLTEYQDLVYREDPSPDTPAPTPPRARADEDRRAEHSFSSTLLFRYSALTFNGHRIHYDEAYARTVEHYNGLVVHGPLLAQLLMLMATEALGPLKSFTFRATSPLMHTEPVTLCQKGNTLWARAPDGRQCMSAEAQT
ncbi:MaoC family dehydratase N-terminal domain-containing protein [uncultured Lentibacter sp.]|uniref:FAS1-like dehydratase domain-containing protein n=1 Tax=uncultured Lentibacter sp. TaxID=1659309 RepID=UPI0026066202|nr:MaoC family dehydratase N-terminal domain-containing protein [uncultured Lentibacter sp.]